MKVPTYIWIFIITSALTIPATLLSSALYPRENFVVNLDEFDFIVKGGLGVQIVGVNRGNTTIKKPQLEHIC